MKRPPPCLAALALLPFAPASGDEPTLADPASLRHGIVFQEEGKFGGWPANGGMWHWGDEILVCFTKADHKEQAGHTFDKSTARNTFGRSLDGGHTWRLEDARAQGITAFAHDHQVPDGRLVLAYAFRRGGGEGSSICARISKDEGRSWSNEIVLRGNDGANGDIGYPRIVRREDGKLVVAYYWNHALDKDRPPYRHIAFTIWNQGN